MIKYFSILTITFLLSLIVQAAPIVSNLVEPIYYYTDRENQFADLKKQFNNEGVIVEIVGISGIGKTQLSRKYTYFEQDKYNIIWTIDLSSGLKQQFLQLAKEINSKFCKEKTQCEVIEDIDNIEKNVINFLNTQKSWLLIVDNITLNNNDKVNDVILGIHKGHVLLCSQQHLNIGYVIPIKELDEEFARVLVKKINPNMPEQDMAQLSAVTSNYPILLAQSAQFLSNNKNFNLKDYYNIMDHIDNKQRINEHIKLAVSKLTVQSKNLLIKLALINNHNFSKKLIKQISGISEEEFSQALYKLSFFALIQERSNDSLESFEMHDIVKKTLLETTPLTLLRQNLNEVIELINKSLVGNGCNLRINFHEDETLKNNIEEIVNNAEKYDADIYKTLELRKNLLIDYVTLLDYKSWKEEIDWLKNIEDKNLIDYKKLKFRDAENYAWFLIYKGLYEEFNADNSDAAIEDLKLALDLARKGNNQELLFTIYSNLAQIQGYKGEIESAQSNIYSAKNITDKDKSGDFDLGLLWFMSAKVNLEKGEYDRAIEDINLSIESDKDKPQDQYTLSSSVLKIEILARKKDYNEAYLLGKDTYNKSKEYFKEGSDQQSRILNWLALSEYKLTHIDKAKKHIKKAKDILLESPELADKPIDEQRNEILGTTLLIEGIINSIANDTKEADRLFKSSESVFRNRFQEHMKVDIISVLYYEVAQSAIRLKDQFSYMQYLKKHEELFGTRHFRTIELYEGLMNF